MSNLASRLFETKTKPFAISLIEDNHFYLQGIVNQIKQNVPNAKLTAFTRSSSFIRSLRHKPQIAVVDFYLDERSEIDGVELIRELKLKSPKTQIIVLIGEERISTALKCLNEGVLDYIVKEERAVDEVVDKIKELMNQIVTEKEKDALNSKILFLIITLSMLSIALFILKILFPNIFN
jgi:DNA-binding NarL/FixJ family response regulator